MPDRIFPEGNPNKPENPELTLEQVAALLGEVKISKKNQIIILRGYQQASRRQKQWLKERLEKIIGSSDKVSKDAYKGTLIMDWENILKTVME